MAERGRWLGFLLRLVMLYVLLAVPWPGWRGACAAGFREVAGRVFGNDDRRELSFEAIHGESGLGGDVQVVIVNRSWMQADGSGPVRNLDLDTAGFWRPVALFVALVLASPISARRRAAALWWGLPALLAVLLALLGFFIWRESAEVGLVVFSPFWKAAVDGAKEALPGQFGLSIPVLIWLVVTFQREDRARLWARPEGGLREGVRGSAPGTPSNRE